MNSTIYQKHNVEVPQNYLPIPESHFNCDRDLYHYNYTAKYLVAHPEIKTLLDVGAWDSWLGLIIATYAETYGMHVTTMELIPGLAMSAYKYAEKNNIKNFLSLIGSFEDYPIPKEQRWDLITCYEVLEHVQSYEVPAFLKKIEAHADHVILSLPNQNHLDNPQHQWTPTDKNIESMFGEKKNINISYVEYQSKTPGNWFITYDTV
jgi:2-polyprenyl-3-methyl-5-hydroxy-6-metoxy-1,4-benzoquinol methylase